MKNKKIQEKRMKSYFIQAAKEILKAEGLKSISVRNIADRAGYSYTTMYHYFRNTNDLLFYCIQEFQEEINDYVSQTRKADASPLQQLQTSSMAYAKYFVEYPGIFELFYLELAGDFNQKKETLHLIANSFQDATKADWTNLANNTKVEETTIVLLQENLKLITIGALLLYINRNTPEAYKAFLDNLSEQLNHSIICHLPNNTN